VVDSGNRIKISSHWPNQFLDAKLLNKGHGMYIKGHNKLVAFKESVRALRGGSSDAPVHSKFSIVPPFAVEEQLTGFEVPRPIYSNTLANGVRVLAIELMGIRSNYASHKVDTEYDSPETVRRNQQLEAQRQAQEAERIRRQQEQQWAQQQEAERIRLQQQAQQQAEFQRQQAAQQQVLLNQRRAELAQLQEESCVAGSVEAAEAIRVAQQEEAQKKAAAAAQERQQQQAIESTSPNAIRQRAHSTLLRAEQATGGSSLQRAAQSTAQVPAGAVRKTAAGLGAPSPEAFRNGRQDVQDAIRAKNREAAHNKNRGVVVENDDDYDEEFAVFEEF